jgi:hypothetical protein
MKKKPSIRPVMKRKRKSWPVECARPEITVRAESPNMPKRTTYFLPNLSEMMPAMIGVKVYPQREPAPTMPSVVLSVPKVSMREGISGPKTHL